MIFEVQAVSDWAVRREQHAVLISPRGVLHSFRVARHDFVGRHFTVLKVFLTRDEEQALLYELPHSMDFDYFARGGHSRPRTLEGVPVEILDAPSPHYRGELYPLRRPLRPTLPTCAECGKAEIKQTYRSTRDQREICLDCFEGRKKNGLAKEKAVHPLDAWMA